MKVIWTPDAEETFKENISFLAKEWSDSVIENFIARTEEAVATISKHPLLYPVVFKGDTVHKCLVVRQVSLYYRIFTDRIDLLIFWNNFQEPKKLKL